MATTGEKRFDVRIPEVNRVLLEKLAEERKMTGVPEGRLIVVWLNRYVKMDQTTPFMVTAPPQAVSTNGHIETKIQLAAEEIPPVLEGSVLNSYMEDE